MVAYWLIWAIQTVTTILTIVLLVDIFLSYFMSPFSPVRMTLDRIVGPMLAPIRRRVPPIGGTLDISPIILWLLIQLAGYILIQIVRLFAGLFS